jgi:CelD/BcsL family acetyltransferase involved in cellulose biosynthesis
MEFSCVRTTTEWDALALEWDLLFARSHLQVPFLHFGYLRAWWQSLGGAEWQPENSTLCIITAREHGELVGIAPLFLGSKPGWQPALRLIGSVEVSDYLDLLAPPDVLDAFLSGLLAFLKEDPEMRAYPLELLNLREDSRTLLALPRAAELSGYTYSEEHLQPSPYIVLAESWDAYLAGVHKKQRHEIRRKVRNAENRHQMEWYTVQDAARLEEEVDVFYRDDAPGPAQGSLPQPRHARASAGNCPLRL